MWPSGSILLRFDSDPVTPGLYQAGDFKRAA
jgi:hypothetical protein